MEDIVKYINNAEAQAEEIKTAANIKAAGIIAEAEAEAAEILKNNDRDIRLYRESEIAKADKKAESDYLSVLEAKRAEAETYADKILKKADSAVADIVRRITRGNS